MSFERRGDGRDGREPIGPVDRIAAVARRSGVSLPTIKRLEAKPGLLGAYASTLAAIRTAFEEKESSSSTQRLPVCDYIAGQSACGRRDGPNVPDHREIIETPGTRTRQRLVRALITKILSAGAARGRGSLRVIRSDRREQMGKAPDGSSRRSGTGRVNSVCGFRAFAIRANSWATLPATGMT